MATRSFRGFRVRLASEVGLLDLAQRCTYQGLEFASGSGATADVCGPAASVSNGAFDAEPTSAALNNGTAPSSAFQPYSAVTGMASFGPQSIYLTIAQQADMEDPERRS